MNVRSGIFNKSIFYFKIAPMTNIKTELLLKAMENELEAQLFTAYHLFYLTSLNSKLLTMCRICVFNHML